MLAAGDLDLTFDFDGLATTDFFNESNTAHSVVIHDGKIIVAGSTGSSGNSNFALARYNANGSLDTTFSDDGTLTTDFGIRAGAYSVAVHSDGAIVAAGWALTAGNDWQIALARYQPNGALDTSFDGDGKLLTTFSGFSEVRGIAIQADGRIVVAGTSNGDFLTARFKTDGSLDMEFGGGDGFVTTDFAGGDDRARSITIHDGMIIVAGAVSIGGYELGLARYDSSGSLDTSLDQDGKLVTPVQGSGFGQAFQEMGNGVCVQDDGKIVVAGSSNSASTGSDIAVWRYNANGSADTSFSGDGVQSTAVGTYDDHGYGLVIQSDGKIVVAGYGSNGSDDDFALVRYNTNGSLDRSFGGDGKVTNGFVNASTDRGFDVALQPDGGIVIVGFSSTGSSDFALARYQDSNSSTNIGDYNNNGVVDAADYSTWRNVLGANVPPYTSSDGSGNGVIDQADYDVWKLHFGMTLPASSAGSGAAASFSSEPEPVVDVRIEATPRDASLSASVGSSSRQTLDVSLPARFAPRRSALGAHAETRSTRSDDALLRAWLSRSNGGESAFMDRSERVSSISHDDGVDEEAVDSVFAGLGAGECELA